MDFATLRLGMGRTHRAEYGSAGNTYHASYRAALAEPLGHPGGASLRTLCFVKHRMQLDHALRTIYFLESTLSRCACPVCQAVKGGGGTQLLVTSLLHSHDIHPTEVAWGRSSSKYDFLNLKLPTNNQPFHIGYVLSTKRRC